MRTTNRNATTLPRFYLNRSDSSRFWNPDKLPQTMGCKLFERFYERPFFCTVSDACKFIHFDKERNVYFR